MNHRIAATLTFLALTASALPACRSDRDDRDDSRDNRRTMRDDRDSRTYGGSTYGGQSRGQTYDSRTGGQTYGQTYGGQTYGQSYPGPTYGGTTYGGSETWPRQGPMPQGGWPSRTMSPGTAGTAGGTGTSTTGTGGTTVTTETTDRDRFGTGTGTTGTGKTGTGTGTGRSTETGTGTGTTDRDRDSGATSTDRSGTSTDRSGTGTTGTGTTGTTTAPTEAEILAVLAAIDDHEARVSAEVANETVRSEVRDFAKEMQTAHGKSAEETRALATRLRLTASETSPHLTVQKDKCAKAFSTLETLDGPAFERAYVDAMVKDHQEALTKIDGFLKTVQREEIRKHLEETRTHVQEHLDDARALQKTLGESKDTDDDAMDRENTR